MILSIDTSTSITKIMIIGPDEIEVSSIEVDIGSMLSTQILQLINQLIDQANLRLSDIDSVTVNKGPGSFTGLRIGCSVANALSYSLGVPLADGERLAVPEYGSEPNITKPRK